MNCPRNDWDHAHPAGCPSCTQQKDVDKTKTDPVWSQLREDVTKCIQLAKCCKTACEIATKLVIVADKTVHQDDKSPMYGDEDGFVKFVAMVHVTGYRRWGEGFRICRTLISMTPTGVMLSTDMLLKALYDAACQVQAQAPPAQP